MRLYMLEETFNIVSDGDGFLRTSSPKRDFDQGIISEFRDQYKLRRRPLGQL